MVEGEICLGDETVPFSEWKGWINGREASNKMIFPCLDGSFGGIAAVTVGGNALKIDVVFGESGFNFGGTFIVDDVEFWGVSVGLEEFVGFEPSVADGAAEAVR